MGFSIMIANVLIRRLSVRIDLFRRLFVRATRSLIVARERRILKTLTDAQLRDMGLTREQALAESRRSPLDLPKGRWRGW